MGRCGRCAWYPQNRDMWKPGGSLQKTTTTLARCTLAVSLALLVCQGAGAATVIKTLKATRPGYYEAVVRYPQFTDRTPLVRLANREMERWARDDFQRWVGLTREYLRDAGKPDHPLPLTYSARPEVTYFSASRLISMHIVASEYGGGAHLVFGGRTFNYGLVDGKPKDLHLRDLFLPGTEYYRLVRGLIHRKLKETGAPGAVADYVKSIQSFPDYFLEDFLIGRDGLRYVFLPGSIATYADGSFEATLTIRELGSRFRKELLLGP